MKHDFYRIVQSTTKRGAQEIYPEFLVRPSKELMTRGGKFYAILDKSTGLWCTDEGKVQEFVDEELYSFRDRVLKNSEPGTMILVKDLMSFRSRSWTEYKNYVSSLPDCYHQLDDKLCFSNTKVEPKDYISKCLPYPLESGSYDSWNELVGTLYAPEEREKIEWAIGAIVSGDSKDIQKFVVLYGDPGAGKGTIIEIIKKLFPGYFEVFDAKSLSNNSNAFAFEQFRTNPLIALQSDGDLSRIEDNTKINSLVSHETIVMNEKRKSSYNFTPHCFLFMASNSPVKITNAKSGIIRRLIDVHPTGTTLPKGKYDQLMGRIGFELSGIAWHCLEVYRELGKNYYNGYRPLSMMYQTDAFFNFMEENYDIFMENDGISLRNAYEMWNTYCSDSGIDIRMPRYKFREELRNYFNNFDEVARVDGLQVRSWFSGFRTDRFKSERRGRKDIPHEGTSFGLVLDQKVSLLDEMLKDCVAQYGVEDGKKPKQGWDKVKTTLKELDTSRLHFILLPWHHIVIDFDLKNENGEKDMMLNLEAASKWPRTYAEYSQGGKGIHLHYIYYGDPAELEGLYSKDIEVKVYTGKMSLRRRLSLCNNIPVATLHCGLPKKEAKKNEVIDFESVKDEQHIRNIVAKCLRKDIAQPYTAPAMSLIKKTLDDAYEAGVKYDIRDMRPVIAAFAAKSHHQKQICMKMVEDLHFTGPEGGSEAASISKDKISIAPTEAPEGAKEAKETAHTAKVDIPLSLETKHMPENDGGELVFFDIEVFPNLLLVNWKEAGKGKGVVRMINPTRVEIGELLRKKLVGFNCRRYDNHILYARYIGYNNEAIYRLSQRLIDGSRNAMFGNAYDISYTDVYDFAAKKQSLKKWEIELGIHHQELGLPWNQPVPEERWAEVAEYCDNDVIATEAVFDKLAGDFKAREILAEIAGMTVNDTTNSLTTKIIFGDDPEPQKQFVYPNLAEKFPGYLRIGGKSYYRHEIPWTTDETVFEKLKKAYGEDHVLIDISRKRIEVDEEIGEGGRVYARPGIHRHVKTFDVASMHPNSIIAENGFGRYTERFKQLLDIRIAIKHKDFDKAKKMLNGQLARYLDDPGQAKALSQALKIAINSVYGLTAAGFDNKFRDKRNVDNWVAKRGALFIETLRLAVTKRGGSVVHIKTDSIKVEDPTPEIEQFIMDYGKQYGYTFEVESIYEKMCLVNNAVYIALKDRKDPEWLDECKKAEKDGLPEPTRWTATGAQFAHPYVFKTLFSHEEIEFQDLCETKTVTSALYLDMNENLSDVSIYEKDLDKLMKRAKLLLKEIGYSGNYDEWLKDEDWKFNNPALTEMQKDQIHEELLDIKKDREVLEDMISKGHNYIFIGKAGSFCPVKSGCGGGILVREKDGKFNGATGSIGFRWREGESLQGANRMEMIDMGYFENLAEEAKKAIRAYGDFDEFQSEPEENSDIPKKEPISIDRMIEETERDIHMDRPPWLPPCGDGIYDNCYDCPSFRVDDDGNAVCGKEFDLTNYIQMGTILGEAVAMQNRLNIKNTAGV